MGLLRSFATAIADSRPYNWAKNQVLTTPIEIAFVGVVLSSAFGIASHKVQKNNNYDLYFSEIEKTQRNLSREGKEVPPLTWYYSIASDVTMKEFESKNMSRHWFDNADHSFAYELEKKIEPTLRVHVLIPEYAKAMPDAARAALKSLDKQVKASQDLPRVINEFDNTWSESHDDVYKTVHYTESVCTTNSSGNRSCHNENRTKQVYDYTIHTYNYYPQHGEAAARNLVDFLQKHPEMSVDEKLIRVTSTEADNESAIHHSFHKFKHRYPNIAEYIEAANIWLTGSNLTVFTPPMIESHAQLQRLSPQWNAAKQTAHYESYRTNSHYDSGPREYQVAQSALGQARKMDKSMHKFLDGIVFAAQNTPKMSELAQQCVNTALHYKPGDMHKLCRQTLKLAEEIYAKNFEGGIDPRPYKWEMVLLWSLVGLALGCALGGGIDKYLNSRQSLGIGFKMGLTRPRYSSGPQI